MKKNNKKFYRNRIRGYIQPEQINRFQIRIESIEEQELEQDKEELEDEGDIL